MRRRSTAVVIILAALLIRANTNAQDFSDKTIISNYQTLDAQDRLDQFDEQIYSILKLFSSFAGSGFVNSASLHKIGGIDVGVRGVLAIIPEELRDIVKTPQDLPDPLEDSNVEALPFFHASLGLPANFEVMGKFFSIAISEAPRGNITVLGGALKYGLFQDNLGTPAIALLAGYQTVLVPDEYAFGTVSTLSFKGFISKDFSVVTLYAGGGVERTALTIDIPGIITRDYDLTYPNGTVGLTLSPFPPFKLNADFNFGEVNNFTAGVSLSFR